MTIDRRPQGLRCSSCGREAREHRHVYPARATPRGPIYFDCWGDAQRELAFVQSRHH